MNITRFICMFPSYGKVPLARMVGAVSTDLMGLVSRRFHPSFLLIEA